MTLTDTVRLVATVVWVGGGATSPGGGLQTLEGATPTARGDTCPTYPVNCNRSCYKHGRMRKIAFGARPTIHCRRSLQGPWHGPSGTQPSSAIVSALPTIALATSAPIYLHLCSRTGARRPRCACTAHKVQRKHILISMLRGTHSAHTLYAVQAQRGRRAPVRLQR